MKKIGVLLTALAMVFMSCEQPLNEDYLREVISGMMTEESGNESSNETTPIEITWEKVDDSGIIPIKNEDGYYEFYLNSYKYQFNMNRWYLRSSMPPMYTEYMSDDTYSKDNIVWDKVYRGEEDKVFIKRWESVDIYTGIRWTSSEPCYLKFFPLKEGINVSTDTIMNVEEIAGEIVIRISGSELHIGDGIAKVFVVPLVYPTTAKVKE